MKNKHYWIIGIVIILAIISVFILYNMFKYYPVGSCNWTLEKDYKISVNSKQQAADLINEYYSVKIDTWKNITAEEINNTGNDFNLVNGPIKIDNSGKLFWLFCPV
jgi:hypothetical protein